MGIKIIKGKERFFFETNKDDLEDARSYFPDSSTFMNEGLGRDISRSCAKVFSRIKTVEYTNVNSSSVLMEEYRRILYYALMFRQGKRYDPKTFVRPDFKV